MKNILKMLPILLLTILLSCKKKDPKPEVFDITKYSIVGKLSTGYPYIITIESDKAVLTSYSVSDGKYTYTDGVLKLNFNGGEVICSFTIENGSIKAYVGPVIINTYDLVKIPATNQLEGKNFKGSWNGSGYLTQVKFTGAKYTEITNGQQNEVNYTLINNLAVKKEEGINITVFMMLNGKLEGGRYRYPNTDWGTFMKE
ncbi:hypothetical protein [Pedobacter frigoris]|uniref:Uncharacterized protein n=1 Tax=Pedobacter frigoris TaxID=2571272 RepID=A0A4U1CNB3_9SPHI|nr:hypothetical protein [Pedobacter frigoris]TKC08933.1 hypothetical protein FA047_02220 [Pedobacter frigoris]